MKTTANRPTELSAVFILTLLLFIALFFVRYPTRYDNMGGDNIWQSASTVKYVNMWLEEGPAALHFTAYENYASAEFSSLAERVPFISYPNGHVVLVWLCARLTGRSEIDISFVKHLQLILFAMETMLFAGFVDLFLYGKNAGSVAQRVVASVSTAALWALLPVNAWYLPNVFFTDQSVLLYVMAFLFLEEALTQTETLRASSPPRILLRALFILVVFCGVMTDYYFWILTFFVFIFRLAGSLLRRDGAGKTIFGALFYIVPVAAAVVCYFIQLRFTEDWAGLLLYKLRFRTGGYDDLSALVSRLIENFSSSFTQEQRSFMFWLFLFQFACAAAAIGFLLRERRPELLLADGDLPLILAVYVSVAFQILMLKNHSAVHEFSMMKAGWCVAMTAPLAAVVAVRVFRADGGLTFLGRPVRPFFAAYLLCFFILLLITGVPTSTSRYIVSRDGEQDYSMATFLRENTGRSDVCFSFTEEIPYEPPHDLTVSHKRVWPVAAAEEIDTMFPSLPDDARKLLLINRRLQDVPADVRAAEDGLRATAAVRAENEDYELLVLP